MSTPKQITPPDPQRGICPTCGLWARLPKPNEDAMHTALAGEAAERARG
tara:strand:+ start:840 stop:986 length:147 start_codon:yes stop_codon:yes gene_type:complete